MVLWFFASRLSPRKKYFCWLGHLESGIFENTIVTTALYTRTGADPDFFFQMGPGAGLLILQHTPWNISKDQLKKIFCAKDAKCLAIKEIGTIDFELGETWNRKNLFFNENVRSHECETILYELQTWNYRNQGYFKCFNALPVYTCTGAQGLTYSGVWIYTKTQA